MKSHCRCIKIWVGHSHLAFCELLVISLHVLFNIIQKMEGIDIFCASQASTAIYLNMDQPSSSSSVLLGGRAIDRHNPIIGDGRRFTKGLPTAPCSSHQPPVNPKPYHQLQNTGKTSSKKSPSTDQTKKYSSDPKKKSSSKSSDAAGCKNKSYDKITDIIMKGCFKPTTPSGSSRYLLSDVAFFSDHDPVLALVPVEPNKKPMQAVKQEDESTTPKLSSSSSSRSEKPYSNQVYSFFFYTLVYCNDNHSDDEW